MQLLKTQLFSSGEQIFALLSNHLYHLIAQIIRLSMELYEKCEYMEISKSRPKMIEFFNFYSVRE